MTSTCRPASLAIAWMATSLAIIAGAANAQGKNAGVGRANEREGGRGNGAVGALGVGVDPAGWQVPAEILRAVPATIGDGFGGSCAMNEAGTILVVGAPDSAVGGSPAVGAVHVYEFDAVDGWVHTQKIECPPFFAADFSTVTLPSLSFFGWSVAVSGETIVVGAPITTAPIGQAFEGRVYVYRRNETDLLWGNEVTAGEEGEQLTFRAANKILKAADPEMIGYFGGSVAVDLQPDGETRIAVGSPYRGAANQGGVYVFEGTGNAITQKRFLIPEDVIGQDNFGTKVSLDDGLLVVGAQLADSDVLINSGAAYIYRRGGDGTWPSVQEAILLPENAAKDDGFGSSVSVLGSTIAVGAPGTDRAADGTTSTNNGSVYVYANVAGMWTQQAELVAREANGGNAFGFSVALAGAGNLLFVGSPGYETTLANAGAGFAFRSDGAAWTMEPTDLWTANAGVSQAVGEQTAINRAGTRAVLGSRNNATPSLTVNRMFAWDYSSDPMPAPEPVGTPATAHAPGVSGANPGQTTTTTPPGGVTPTTGGFGGGGSAAIPAMPTIEEWGVVRASVIAVDRANARLMILMSDGNGQLETNGKSSYFLASYDPTWEVLGLGDVNGDGSSDILFRVPLTRKVKAMIRVGKTIQEIVTVGTASEGDEFIGISDWTNNGFEGPAFLHTDGTATFWVVQGGAVSSHVDWTLPEGEWSFRMAQMTADDNPDILARNATDGKLYRVQSSSTGGTLHELVPPQAGYQLAAALDLDKDGQTDFAWGDPNDGLLHLQFFNSNGSVRFSTAWDTGLSGWRIDPALSFTTAGTGVMFSNGDGAVLVLTIRFEPYASLPSGRGAIRVDYARVIGEISKGYEILGPADEP